MHHRGYIELAGDSLYIANDGFPFDRNGVIAISRANLSAKSDAIKDPLPQLKNDEEWLEEFKERQIRQYQEYEERLTTDNKEEAGTVKDYSGRWLLELLQNIDDAIGPKDASRYIGTKGLGFLSVLEIAYSPAIFSGNFGFEFSQEKNRTRLVAAGLVDPSSLQVPSFQIPWPVKPDTVTERLQSDGYSTIIRLNIRPERSQDVHQDLVDLDFHFLLFSQNLKSLTVKTESYFNRVEINNTSHEEPYMW